jgi:branched-chain amino acid transport system substrate-binding protein
VVPWLNGRGLTALCAVFLTLAGCQSGAQPPPIVLGHVANLSGVHAVGRHAEQGIDFALKEATDAHIAEALDGRPLHVRHTDTRGALDAYESEAVRLVNVNRVAGLIGGHTPAEVRALDSGHVPVLTPCGVRPAGVSDLVFTLGMRPAQQASVLARYAAEDLRLSQIVIMADERRDELVNVADAFGRDFADLRHGKAKTESLRFGNDVKWDDLAKRIAAQKPIQAVFFAGSARDWLELRRAQTFDVPVLFAGADGDAANLAAGDGQETIYYATAFAADPAAPRTQAFIQRYRDSFKEEPNVTAALGYEALQLYAAALKELSPTFTIEKLAAALRGTKDFAGLAGPLTMTDQSIRRPLYVMRRKGATLALQRRYEPAALP